MKKLLVILLAIIPTLYFIGTANSQTSAPPTKESVLAVIKEDVTLGSKNAKVTVFEYSSLSCPHCAYYHADVFPKIKKDYIDTGKIKYVIRDFPTNQPAVAASLLINCVKENKLNFIDMLFESQRTWAYDMDYKDKLRNFARLGGISDNSFDKCINNLQNREAMLQKAYDASQALDISATPAFFINGKKLEGIVPYARFAEYINRELGKH